MKKIIDSVLNYAGILYYGGTIQILISYKLKIATMKFMLTLYMCKSENTSASVLSTIFDSFNKFQQMS